MRQDYSAHDLGFTPQFDMSNTQASDIDYYSFDHPELGIDQGLNHMAAYDMPLSPTMSGNDMFFNANIGPMHIDPAATWNASDKQSTSAHVNIRGARGGSDMASTTTDHAGETSGTFGQITPPSENDDHVQESAGKRADSGIGHDSASLSSRSSSNHLPTKARTASTSGQSSKRARRESQMSEEDDDEAAVEGVDGSKREKYREKNRVAAAKCRAKKKTHVDRLEDTHRTQSVLNTALKQTEKSLRDELSFWRTQALQHTFCNCRSIQEYNMRKAQNLAAESILGNHISDRSPSMQSISCAPVLSPTLETCEVHPDRSQVEFDTCTISPVIAPMSMNDGAGSMAPSSTTLGYQTVGRPNLQTSSKSMARDQAITSNAEQELKRFVQETAE